MATEYCTPSVRIYSGSSWTNKGTATDWYGYSAFGASGSSYRGLEISFTPTKATTSQFHILVPQCVSNTAGNNTWYYRVTDSQKSTAPSSVTGNIASGSVGVYSNVNSYAKAQFNINVSGITAGKKYYVYLYTTTPTGSNVGYVANHSSYGLIEVRNYYTETTYYQVTCKDRLYYSYGTLRSTTTVSTKDYPSGTGAYGRDWGMTAPTGYYYHSDTSTNTSGTVYRNFYPNSYTVKYNVNGGSGSISSTSRYYNESYTLTSSIPTRQDYDFVGWNTSSSATTGISSGGTASASTSTSTITYYAIWKQKTTFYYRMYDVTNGEYLDSSSTSSTASSITRPTVPTGYTYAGYKYHTSFDRCISQISYDGTETSCTTNSSYPYILFCYTATSYSVRYDLNGGSGTISNTYRYYNKEYTLTSSIPTRQGYNFVGWSTSSSATTGVSSGSTISPSASTSAITYYAIWEKDNSVYFGVGNNWVQAYVYQSVNDGGVLRWIAISSDDLMKYV